MRGTYQFREVKYPVSKQGKCVVCNKKRTRYKTFSQTLNPWNKKADGTVKTSEDILKELHQESLAWKLEPIVCRTCGNWSLPE